MKDFLQENFDKEFFDSFLNFKVESDVDYFEGDWFCCPLFVKNLCNYSLIKDSYSPVEIITFLKKLNFIGANVNLFGPNTKVFDHTDADLLRSKAVTRIFIPLEPNYVFEYSGSIYRDKKVITVHKEVFKDEMVIFSPRESHSYTNLSDKNQYFLIGDLADSSKLDSNFWNNYLYMCAKHYI